MYESFYGFKEKPFNINPDPDYLYMSGAHEKAYTYLEYAIAENKAFVVITGEIGSGKTTLINFLLRKIPQDINVGILNNTNVLPLQFIKMICQEFELTVDGLDKAGMLDTLHQFLLKQFAERKRVVLIIDEAQNLPSKSIEETRLLSNLEAEKHHLIQIILMGQPELKYKLQRKDLEQFAQRVTVSNHLEGLKKEEVHQYIHHRLKVGGANNLDIFNNEAIEAIYKYSQGIPRIINIICDTALVHGYADDIKIIDRKIVEEVIETREIGGRLPSVTENAKTHLPPSPDKAETIPEYEKRGQYLENRIDLLESIVTNLDQRLNDWVNKKEKQESNFLELLKMFKDSLENRRHMILKYSQLKKRLEMDKEKSALLISKYAELKKRLGMDENGMALDEEIEMPAIDTMGMSVEDRSEMSIEELIERVDKDRLKT